ncbi:hypothetical protein FOMG_18719 [Fusarium oxysporum f. sp. melonis 26406]|uniref:Uncharacterized protein n=1 Tax=Fusarium oxysporum f. sp. melonis 26406 TaxID=1089452 RepID=W9Z7K5_FUSOX|nr:hypothetical protein FOMG_18719 [Fusarium oxysporum f. sp. melonis 26406]
MSCPCANYYCPDRVQIFDGYCDICLIACTGIPMKNLLPHASSPFSDVKAMSETVWGNKAAANTLMEEQLCCSSIRPETLVTHLGESGL